MTMLKSIHVGLNCANPELVERFYVTHLGFRRSRVIPIENGGQIVFIRNGDFLIELFKASGDSPMPKPEKDGYGFPGLRHLAFQVESVDAVLSGMGKDARVSLGPFDFDDAIKGWRTVWVKDPEGNIVEISQGYADQENPAPSR